MNCILFLDFDGVTHPDPCRKSDYFCQLPLIESVLREHLLVDVVISSSWRYEYQLEALQMHFATDIRQRIIDVTPNVTRTDNEGWIPPELLQHHREWECRKWLRQHRPEQQPWLAIDDADAWFLPDCPNLLRTQSVRGFQPEQASALREMIQQRLLGL
jgi:hypothetical protein